MNPLAYILIGIVGSGKSTYAAKNFPDTTLISSDAYIESKAKEENKTYTDVFHKYIKDATNFAKEQFNQALLAKQTIVIDQTNLSKKSRKEKIDKLKSNGYNVTAIVFEISQDELKRRREKRLVETGKTIPQHIIESMEKSYQPPELSEGFNEILIIRE